MSKAKNDPLDAFSRSIATRYVSVGKRSHLVSFMSAISIAGLALGIAILITVLSVLNGFDTEMRENILGIVPHLTLSSDENISAQRWNEFSETLLETPGISAVAPVIEVAGVAATRLSSRGVAINGINAETEASVSSIANFVTEGSLAALERSRWSVVIGEPLAQQLSSSLGDSIDIFSTAISINPLTPLPTFRSFEVVGIYKVGSENIDSNLIITNLSAAKALFRVRSPYNGLRIRTEDVLAADSIGQEIADIMPSEMSLRSWTQEFGAIYQNIVFSRSIISFMLWMLIAVAAFNLIVSMIMIVRDKTGDIAILRTLGASPAMIRHIFMWQGFFIGSIAIFIGVTFGVLGSLYVSEIAATIESSFGIQLLNAEVYPIDFLPSRLEIADVILVVSGVVCLCLLATFYPAQRAASIQPAAALRSD